MKRWALAPVLVLMVAGVVHTQEVITYRDRAKKKDETIKATIAEEGPAGLKVKLKQGKKEVTKTIAAGDVVQIVYTTREVPAIDFRAPFGKEAQARAESRPKQRAEKLGVVLDMYRKLEGRLRGTQGARRYVQYKIAEIKVLQAQDDPTRLKDAIRELSEFVSGNKSSWQIVQALKLLGKLQEEDGDPTGASKTYEALADLPDVPKELKQESEILVGRLLLRGGNAAGAEKRLAGLAGTLAPGDVQRPFVLAHLVEAQMAQNKLANVKKQLEEAMAATADPRLRGLAYNLLGDYHRKQNQLEDAFWSYLRVDAMYNEDAEEQGKAIYHLAELFDKVKKDPIRGKECLRRLRDKRFAGTQAQKLLPAEEKEPARKAGKEKKGAKKP
jgi:hypothetical protein